MTTNNKSVGRPKMQYGRQVLILDCTEDEIKAIREAFNTRERVQVLLDWIDNIRILGLTKHNEV